MPDGDRNDSQGLSRRTLLASALGIPILLTACSAGHTTIADPSDVASDAISIGLTGPPSSLDFTTTDGSAIPLVLMGNVFEGLVRIDADGELEPLLAKEWSISEDRLTYTFDLRTDVQFSNGEPFNAESAVFSIERVKSDAWTNGLASGMEIVQSATVENSHRLRVELSEPSNSWLWSMGTLIGAMMTSSGVEDLASNPIGTGPFLVDAWSPSQSLRFVANPGYWGQQPASSTVIVQYFSDATASTNALQYGDIDAVYDMQSPELAPVLAEDQDLEIDTGTTTGQVLLSMNQRHAPFDDVRVRQAVMYAVDRQAIIDTAWSGFGLDTGGSPTPQTDPWFVKSDMYPHDPEKARELLREAGATDLTVRLSVPTRPYAQQVSEILVSQLRDVGINVVIQSLEFPALWLDQVFTRHDYQMSIIVHTEARDLPVLFGNPEHYLGFDDPETRELLAKADKSSPQDEAEIMRAAVNRIMEQAAADTLFMFPNIIVRQSNLQGLPADRATDELRLNEVQYVEETRT